jgi:hypothetical protein
MQKTGFGFGVIAGGKSAEGGRKSLESRFVQARLFPFVSGPSIIFVCVPQVSEQEFVSVIRLAQPAVAVELRRAPRFDIGRLSRQTVFKHFEEAKCKYIDPFPSREALSENIRRYIGAMVDEVKKNSGRPLMFFVSSTQHREQVSSLVCDCLGCLDQEWQIFEVPGHQDLPRGCAAKI